MKNEAKIYKNMREIAADLEPNQIKLVIMKNYNDFEVPTEAISALLDVLEAKIGSAEFVGFCNILNQ